MKGNSFTVYANEDQTAHEYYHHSSGQRVNTDIVVIEALRKQYPELDVIVSPERLVPLLSYAASGHATATPLEDKAVYTSVKWRFFLPPARRLDGNGGGFAEQVMFGKYMYLWKGMEFILYIANGRDGVGNYPQIVNQCMSTKGGSRPTSPRPLFATHAHETQIS
jgi:transitional endoplasmic reticulum ATPase